MGLFLSIFFGFVPMFFFAWFVYWLDRYEKEPKILLGLVFFWGAIVAAGAAFLINTLLGLGVYMFTGSEGATEMTTGSLIAPMVEESLKGFAVVIVFFSSGGILTPGWMVLFMLPSQPWDSLQLKMRITFSIMDIKRVASMGCSGLYSYGSFW